MLSPRAIDRIFERLTLIYGRDFAARFDGLGINEVKSEWLNALAYFDNHMDSIAWALENLPPGRAPNCLEFRALCRQAPRPDVLRIEHTRADPEIMHRELAKMHAMVADLRKKPGTAGRNLEWAKRLLERHESGEYRSTPAAVKMARDALEGK